MNLFTRNSPYYHLLKYLLFLLKHPVYTHTILCLAWRWRLRVETCRRKSLQKENKDLLDCGLKHYLIISRYTDWATPTHTLALLIH